MPMFTRRERIQQELEATEYPLTAKDLCDILDIRDRSIVFEDIQHIAKSVQNEGKQVLMSPARCGECDYVFRSRNRAKSPSKCPKCKSEWILPPGFIIDEID